MDDATLVMMEVILLFFATPFLYFYHQKRYMAVLAIFQYVLNALLMCCLVMMYPLDLGTKYLIFETIFHLALIVSSALVVLVTLQVLMECIRDFVGDKNT